MKSVGNIGLDAVIQVSSEPVSTTMREETVILDPSSGRYFGLDGVGARVWELLQEPRTLTELLDIVADEYEMDRPTCEGDLRRLLADLSETGLIIIDGRSH